jgi:hypothetical protein
MLLPSETARTVLGVVRLVNGLGALIVPATLARRFGVDPETNPAALYVLRLFGIRTVLLGTELLFGTQEEQGRALRVAPWIHASDATAAVIAGIRGQLPRRAAVFATVVSSVNTGLALVARGSA